jgi:hypothetical protein
MPPYIEIELRGGPFCGAFTKVYDLAEVWAKSIEGICYEYRLVRLRCNKGPVVFEHVRSSVVCPKRIADQARRVDAALECGTDETL